MAKLGAITKTTTAKPGSRLSIDWQRFLTRPLATSCCLESDRLFAGKTVLITGAGGSIGSCLSERLMEGSAGKLILLDRSGANLRDLRRRYEERDAGLPAVEFVQGDILSQELVQETLSAHRPEIVFHAAALKDIPPLESDPFSALENNVLGTVRLIKAASAFPVECFVYVSTDKAAIPASVLGVSKRIGELLLLKTESSSPANMRKVSVRLGNVLGSSGSVVPIFLRFIADQKPLPISDPLATRYFLTLEETTVFLSQSLLAPASSLLLPEMGEPHKIVDLAGFLLDEFGPERSSPMIEFVGLKDGEKQSEHLRYEYEFVQGTIAPQLYQIGGNNISDPEKFALNLERLISLVTQRRKTGLLECLSDFVPEFSPSSTLLRYLG